MPIVASELIGEDERDAGFGGGANHTGLNFWWGLEGEGHDEDILVAEGFDEERVGGVVAFFNGYAGWKGGVGLRAGYRSDIEGFGGEEGRKDLRSDFACSAHYSYIFDMAGHIC